MLIVGDLENPFSTINRSYKENLNRDMMENRCHKPHGIIDIYRTIHPNTKAYTCFSSPQGTFAETDHIFWHKQVSTDTRKLK